MIFKSPDVKVSGQFVRDSGQNVAITKIYNNTSQEIINTTSDRLRINLTNHLSRLEINKAWQTPFGLFVTIILVFCTADFKAAFGLSKDTWNAIFVIGAAASFVWLVVCVLKVNKSVTVDDVIEAIRTAPQ
jgi:hypothetical protein